MVKRGWMRAGAERTRPGCVRVCKWLSELLGVPWSAFCVVLVRGEKSRILSRREETEPELIRREDMASALKMGVFSGKIQGTITVE
jgi:hypothetical protein